MNLCKHIACIAMMCVPCTLHAQCNLHTKVDDFTGKKTVWSDKIKITSGGVPLLLKGNSDDCTYKIYFRFLRNGDKTYISVSEDGDCYCTIRSISLKFQDEKVLIKDIRSRGEELKTLLGEEHYSLFEISADDLKLLSETPLRKFKIVENGCMDHPFIEDEFDRDDMRSVKVDAGCVSNISTSK